MIYVQHLLGVGHLKRMSILADGLTYAGAEVLLVSGGMPAPHIQPRRAVSFHQLPPVKSIDEGFSGLADRTGASVTEEFMAARCGQLLEALNSFRPETLVVELFPLGRRQMRFELLPLLETARPMCRTIACSVRDIVNKRPKREAEALDWLNRYFDLLLVHGDGALTPIVESVPGIAAFQGHIISTGYLCEPWHSTSDRGNEILVSAGGGSAGNPLFRAAAEASRSTPQDMRWRIRHGTSASSQFVQDLKEIAAHGTIIEPVADDFQQRLSGCALSISQFGYNTAMDILNAGVPAVIVPFEGGHETEQLRRVQALSGRGLLMLRESDLSGQKLAAAIARTMNEAGGLHRSVDMDGLRRTTQILLSD